MKKMFGMKAALVLALVWGGVLYLPLAVTEATAARIRQQAVKSSRV